MEGPCSLSVSHPNTEEELEKQRCNDGEMISSLSKGKGWSTHYLYLYQGFWYTHDALQRTIFAQQNFKAQSTDILLATNPKCGTTWLKSLAFAIKNRSAATRPVPHSDEQHSNLLTANPHALIPNLEFGLFQRYSLREVDVMPSPRLLATHIPYSSLPESVYNSGCRVVYMCRDPKDMFVSMYHFFDKVTAKEIPLISFPEAFDLFCQGVSFHGPYWDHVLGYYKASLEWPERVVFFKYEDMQSDTLNQVKRLAVFLGYPFTLEEEAKGVIEEIIQLCSFEKVSKLEVNKKGKLFGVVNNDSFFRKGKVGDSNNYLTMEMVERLNRITEEKFQAEVLNLNY